MVAALTLGEIVFTDFEIPEHFTIGGSQKLAIHSLPGGGRVVDAMGAEDAPIQWSGVFSGQQAAMRVRMLEKLRKNGQSQLLTWDAWRFTVVVETFEAELSSNCWIPYRLKLCVINDSTGWTGSQLLDSVPPLLSTATLSQAGLDTAIAVAGLGLGSSDIGQAIGAAGNLAQYVTARAYGMILS